MIEDLYKTIVTLELKRLFKIGLLRVADYENKIQELSKGYNLYG